MTDVVEIAKRRRSSLVAEIAKLDDFIGMAEALIKLESDPAWELGWLNDFRHHPVAENGNVSKKVPENETIKNDLSGEADIAATGASDDATASDQDARRADKGCRQNLFAPASEDKHQLTPSEVRSEDASGADITIGQKLRQRRWMMGISKTQFAERVGITTTDVQNLELGLIELDMNRLEEIADVLGVTPSYFAEGKEQSLTGSNRDADDQHAEAEKQWSSGGALAKTA